MVEKLKEMEMWLVDESKKFGEGIQTKGTKIKLWKVGSVSK